MQARIKICGITSVEDARLALEEGAHAIGVLVGLSYESVDQIDTERAAGIVRSVGSLGATFLVTHRTDIDAVRRLYDAVPTSTIQLHGDFPLEDVPKLRETYPHLKIVKAVHVTDATSLDRAKLVAAAEPNSILLDSRTSKRIGGTGVTHDWAISRRIADHFAGSPVEVILAGGLDPDNVAEAIGAVLPSAVDVNTGVSGPDGAAKSPDKLKRFMEAVRSVSLPAGRRTEDGAFVAAGSEG